MNYNFDRAAFTPSLSVDNWVLDADSAGDVGFMSKYSWGGRDTVSSGYRTRWVRPTTNATSTFTAMTQAAGSPNGQPMCRVGTFATSAVLGTDPGGNLDAIDWNPLGGGGAIVLPLDGRWLVVNAATVGYQQIVCRNVAGIGASLTNYGGQWVE
jgi:hypothetical protein